MRVLSSLSLKPLARAAALTVSLAGALGTTACTDAYGRTDWGSTLALGAGIGLAAGTVAALASDGHDRHRSSWGQPRGRDFGYSHGGRRYAQSYGGWR